MQKTLDLRLSRDEQLQIAQSKTWDNMKIYRGSKINWKYLQKNKP